MSVLIERRIVGVACESTACSLVHELDVDELNAGALRVELQRIADEHGWVFHLESKRRAYCPVHHDALFTRCTCKQQHRATCPIHDWDDFVEYLVAPEALVTRHAVPGGKDLATALLALTIDGQWVSSMELLARLAGLFGFCSICTPTLRQLAARVSELGLESEWDSPRMRMRGYRIDHAALEARFAGRNK